MPATPIEAVGQWQFPEDSYAIAASFRKGGSWTLQTEAGTKLFQV
jgi:hypothetical protein